MDVDGEDATGRPASDRGTFATEFADAVAARGVTLAYLHRRLVELGSPVSVTALSYWRAGRRHPEGADSLRALSNLETVLGIPAGRFIAAASRERPAAAAAARSGRNDRVEAVLRELDEQPDAGLVDDSLQHVIDVDAHGRPATFRVRCLHRATRDGVNRRVLWIRLKHPDGRARPFVALAGGRIGRTAEDREYGVYGAEFLFDRPLLAGDTVVIEYEVELGPADGQFCELQVARKLRHAMIWVRFHPDRVPPHVEVYREVRGRRSMQSVDMTATTSVHHAVSGRVSGRLGVRWSWT